MRILFSLTYYAPYVSGLSIYVKRLAEMLALRDNDVSVLCMQHVADLPRTENIHRVRVVRAKTLMRVSKGFFSLDWILKAIEETRRAEIVVINLPQAEGLIPAIAAKISGRRLVGIYHSELVMTNKLIQGIMWMINRVILSLADRIIAYTEDFAENSHVLPPYRSKITYTYPLMPNPAIDKDLVKKIRQKIGSGPVIGMAARLAEEKGFEYLFDGVSRLKNRARVAVAGQTNVPGEENYRKKIFGLAEKTGGNVIFLGNIPPEKMGSFYSQIDILAVPSVNSTETFGIVQVEAMRRGVPVIATDLPGVRVPIGKTGMGEVVKPRDPQAIAEAIVKLLEDKKDKNKTARWQQAVAVEFDQRKIKEKFIDVFEK